MEATTGEIFKEPTEEQIKEKNLVKLTPDEAQELEGVPPAKRMFELLWKRQPERFTLPPSARFWFERGVRETMKILTSDSEG